MLYRVSDIEAHVRKVLEVNNQSDALIQTGDIDTLTLDEVITSKIIAAAKYIITNADYTLCGSGVPLSALGIFWEKEKGVGMGSIILPDDFLRLLSFQMLEWETQGRIIMDTDADYALQQSKHAGLRGNPEEPVVAICHYPEGLTLELYSCEAGEKARIKRASYLPIPEIDEDGTIDLPEKLYEAVVYYAAYMTAISLSSVEVANSLLAQAKVMAGISTPEAAATAQTE